MGKTYNLSAADVRTIVDRHRHNMFAELIVLAGQAGDAAQIQRLYTFSECAQEMVDSLTDEMFDNLMDAHNKGGL